MSEDAGTMTTHEPRKLRRVVVGVFVLGAIAVAFSSLLAGLDYYGVIPIRRRPCLQTTCWQVDESGRVADVAIVNTDTVGTSCLVGVKDWGDPKLCTPEVTAAWIGSLTRVWVPARSVLVRRVQVPVGPGVAVFVVFQGRADPAIDDSEPDFTPGLRSRLPRLLAVTGLEGMRAHIKEPWLPRGTSTRIHWKFSEAPYGSDPDCSCLVFFLTKAPWLSAESARNVTDLSPSTEDSGAAREALRARAGLDATQMGWCLANDPNWARSTRGDLILGCERPFAIDFVIDSSRVDGPGVLETQLTWKRPGGAGCTSLPAVVFYDPDMTVRDER